MSSVPLPLLVFLIVCMASSTIRAQSDRPTLGAQLGNPETGVDIIVPPSMTQCEPFLVYYNISVAITSFVAFYTTDLQGDALLTLHVPNLAAGYIDWICNIPAGHSLIVATRDVGGVLRGELYVVQPGSSSSCLADVTATYSIVNYGTNFQSYTSLDNPSETAPFTAASVTKFPSFALSTITASPISTDGSTTMVSPTPTGSPSKPPDRLMTSNKVVIAVSIVGWILIVGLLTTCVWRMGRASRAKRILHDKQYELVSRSDPNSLSSTPHSAQHSVNKRSAPNTATATATTRPAQTSERPAVLGHQAHGSSANASDSGGDLDLEASQLTNSQLPILLANFACMIASNAAPSATSEQPLSTPSQVSPSAVRDQVHSANVEPVPGTISSAQPSATGVDDALVTSPQTSGVNVDHSTHVGVTDEADEEMSPQPTT